MRMILIVAGILSAPFIYGSDPFVGDWKLNPAKSTFTDGRTVTDGRALIEPDNTGGYQQFTETVFKDGPALRFTTHVELDETAHDGVFEERFIKHVSKRAGADTIEIALKDGTVSKVIRMTANQN